ncbi:MAG: sulfite exporter TauE/SafE family protein [Chloroflexota bacterium]
MNPLVIPIIFVAMFIQSLAGFGSALIAMPLLLLILPPDVARPLFVLVGQTAGLMFMFEYRKEWQFTDIRWLLLGSLIAVPIGTWVANTMTEDMFMLVLGIILIGYASYALSGVRLPELKGLWGSFFGFCSGVLHSAYNVGGPPLVMYNSTQDWEARRFKGNTQAIFFVMGFFVIYEHIRAGNMSLTVFQNYLLMTPTMLIALLLGFRLEKYIKQTIFRKMVLVLLMIIGLNLLRGVIF